MRSHPVKRDAIHGAVVDCFRKCGLSVYDAAHAGRDFPDLVVGHAGRTYLVELKTGNAPMTPGQEEFARTWRGSPVVILRSVTEATDWACEIRRPLASRCVHHRAEGTA
jgi:Holliday junction resolvase